MKRSPLLKVVELPEGWEFKTGVPPSRAVCVQEREARLAGKAFCSYINCRSHLWLVEGRDTPGRRYPGKKPKSDIRVASTATCARDYYEPLSVKEIAERMGCSERRVQQLLKAVLQRPHVGDWVRRLQRLKEFIDS